MYNHTEFYDFPTYARGSTRLDYPLISDLLSETITVVGYTPFASLIHSDHRGFYLVFNYLTLFGTLLEELTIISYWKLQSKNHACASIYIKWLYQVLLQRIFMPEQQTFSILRILIMIWLGAWKTSLLKFH